jgi:uncharacterized OsmC-like protein
VVAKILTLISLDLQNKFEGLIEKLWKMHDTEALTTNRAEVRLVKDQHSIGTTRGFTLVQDEPESVFGTGKGPTPTDFFITSIGFCENVIFVRNAALAGLPLDSLETVVTGTWDRRGLFEIHHLSPGFKTITVETKVTTTGPVEKVVEVARQTHRRCPIHVTLMRATELGIRLVVNGQNVQL